MIVSVGSSEILDEISNYCRLTGLAESTFGRMAVNDGKLVSRLRDSGRATQYTVDRIRAFIEENPREFRRFEPAPIRHAGIRPATSGDADSSAGSYEDDEGIDYGIRRLQFVGTTTERKVIAHRLAKELPILQPKSPALKILHAGVDDGIILSRVLASAHELYPNMPHYVVCKCIDRIDAQQTVESLTNNFIEHPNTVLVMTNLSFEETSSLTPNSLTTANNLMWRNIPLQGSTSHDFQKDIFKLRSFFLEHWNLRNLAPTKRNFRPLVLVFHREDRTILLDHILPQRGSVPISHYDLIMAPHSYSAKSSLEFRARRVLAPLASGLDNGGRLIVVQAQGNDPSLQIVKRVWPEENPFPYNRHDILKAVVEALPAASRKLTFIPFSDEESTLCYELSGLVPGPDDILRISSVNAALNAAAYAAEIPEGKIAAVYRNRSYEDPVRSIVAEHNGLWMHDEVFVISKSGN